MADVYDFSVLVEEANIVAKEAVGSVLDGKAYHSAKVCVCVWVWTCG